MNKLIIFVKRKILKCNICSEPVCLFYGENHITAYHNMPQFRHFPIQENGESYYYLTCDKHGPKGEALVPTNTLPAKILQDLNI